jgi:beta-lactamase class A
MIDNAQWLELQKRLGPQGRMGIAARFFRSGGGLQDEVTFNAGQLFPMASIAKIAIAMLVAARVENLELSLSRSGSTRSRTRTCNAAPAALIAFERALPIR